jgi:hypothetical protein
MKFTWKGKLANDGHAMVVDKVALFITKSLMPPIANIFPAAISCTPNISLPIIKNNEIPLGTKLT